MPYFLVSITYDLPDGDTVQLDVNHVEAADQAAVLDRLPELLERIDQVRDNPLIDAIKASNPNPVPSKLDIKPVPAPPPVNDERFVLRQSQKMADGWVVADTEHQVVLTFREHHFNDTQKVTFLNDVPYDYLLAARIMREIGDWMIKYHRELL